MYSYLANKPKGMHNHETTRSHVQNHLFMLHIFLSSGNDNHFITTALSVSVWFLFASFYKLIVVKLIFKISEAILAASWENVILGQKEFFFFVIASTSFTLEFFYYLSHNIYEQIGIHFWVFEHHGMQLVKTTFLWIKLTVLIIFMLNLDM